MLYKNQLNIYNAIHPVNQSIIAYLDTCKIFACIYHYKPPICIYQHEAIIYINTQRLFNHIFELHL